MQSASLHSLSPLHPASLTGYPSLYACFPCRFYSSEEELHRVFKSVNGLIFPGGLTDLWMDSPYVVAARKLWQWSKDANDNGERRPRLSGTACGRRQAARFWFVWAGGGACRVVHVPCLKSLC
jgi:hypothetical protein